MNSPILRRAALALLLVACAEPPDEGVAVGNPGKADFAFSAAEGAEITEAFLPLEAVRLEDCAGEATVVAVDRDVEALAGGDFVELPENEDYCAIELIFAGPVRLIAADVSVNLDLDSFRWESSGFEIAGQEINVRLGEPGWLTAGLLEEGELDAADPRHDIVVTRLRAGSALEGEFQMDAPLGAPAGVAASALVAVGADGVRLTSSFGTTWEEVGRAGEDLFDVVWSENVWVAVGGETGPRILVSADGRTWHDRPSLDDIEPLHAVTWTDGRFVAVGLHGRTVVSEEGWAWREIEAAPFATDLRGVASGDGLIVAVGADEGTSAVRVSDDGGETWGPTESPLTQELYDVVFADGLWVSVGVSGQIATSTNGVDWSLAANGPDDGGKVRSVHWDGAQFTTVGISRAWTSPDGDDWTAANDFVPDAWDSTFAAGNHVAVAEDGRIHVSGNGLDWTPQQVALGVNLYGVAFGGE